MPEIARVPRVLALSDGHAGNENQAMALAAALSTSVASVRLDPRAPWRWFAPRRLAGASHAFGEDFAAHLHPPWPELAIGCGRQAALATRLLRTASSGACKVVQILDPRLASRHWDFVVAPRHDALAGSNVITTLGALHPIDDTWLEAARTHFVELATLPQPRWLLLLGGPTRSFVLDRDYWQALATALRTHLADSGGSLMLSSSRRSPDWLRMAAREAFAGLPGRQWHGPQDGPNPYAGFLAHAERIVVTPDSVNLLSEAAATRVPVWTFAPTPATGKVGRFVAALHASGRIGELGASAPAASVEPLRETARVAAEIRSRLGWN